MYAVIETGGKQFQVQQGDRIRVERLPGDVGSTVEFDKVLLVGGDSINVGHPLVSGARVSATIKAQDRDKKIVVYKFKRRKNYRRKNGHRQHFTEVEITGIKA